jgi:hypothetical protein
VVLAASELLSAQSPALGARAGHARPAQTPATVVSSPAKGAKAADPARAQSAKKPVNIEPPSRTRPWLVVAAVAAAIATQVIISRVLGSHSAPKVP